MCESEPNPKKYNWRYWEGRYWEAKIPTEFQIPKLNVTLPKWKPAEELTLDDLMPFARFLCREVGQKRRMLGFYGYGPVKPGSRVLLGVDNLVDPLVIEAMRQAFREQGAVMDVLIQDDGPDREFEEEDEIAAIIRRAHWTKTPRRYDGWPWILEIAKQGNHDLLMHGVGGSLEDLPCRYEAFHWHTKEQFAAASTTFPREVNLLINYKTWDMLYNKGKGAKVHLTDPEGTDLTWTLFEESWDGRWGWREVPQFGHLSQYPYWPSPPQVDAMGVCCGTMQHVGRAHPRICLTVENGRVEKIEGGGKWGDAWRELHEETKNLQYLGQPRPGLFWIMELALCTNPKVRRPSDVHMRRSTGHEWERLRSGVIHSGWGTLWRGPEEAHAADHGWPYGHLHIHLLFPTVEITTKSGEKLYTVKNGRLTALDDPEVRKVASKYADPDELLREDWIPAIPGISVPGNYEDYARDPKPYIPYDPPFRP